MNRHLTLGLGLAALVLLGAGIAHVFSMRFRVGDVYPPYSSLRTDPLGTRALYDSLAALPGYTVSRNLRPVERAHWGTNTVVLFLGDTVGLNANDDEVPVPTATALNRFLRPGGRMAVTLQPRDKLWNWDEARTNAALTNATTAASNRVARPRPVVLPETDGPHNWIALTNWLDTGFATHEARDMAARVTEAGRLEGLPPVLDCHTALCFTNAGPAWRTLYTCAGRPVVMERCVGRGTLVLSTVSYAVSNEALRDQRETGFLLWLLGGHTHVVFDETHHGIQETSGLMTLVRRYGLTAALANLLVLAALFIWRNSASLVPAGDDEASDGPETAAGKDSATGLGNLLRRNIPRGELVATCLAVWKRTEGPGGRVPATVLRRLEAMVEAERLLPPGQQSPERLYNAMSEVIREATHGAKAAGYRHPESGTDPSGRGLG